MVARNLVTFDKPVFLAGDTDSVVAGATCAACRLFWMLWIGVWGFWLLCAVAVCGAVLVRRRAMTLAPFIGTVVVSTLAALAGYGLWRLRLPIDVAAVALAGVAVASWSARRPAAENAEAQP